MKHVQSRDTSRLNHCSSIMYNRLVNGGLIKEAATPTVKHAIEDSISEFITTLLEQGINNYDVVSLANAELGVNGVREGITSLTKHTDGVWRLSVKIGEQTYSLRKEDVIELATKAYNKAAVEALKDY